MDGHGDEVLRGRLGMDLILAGTVGDGDHCLSPCSSLVGITITLDPLSSYLVEIGVHLAIYSSLYKYSHDNPCDFCIL